MIHPLADVHTSKIGEHTKVWQFSVILEGAIIGNNCNINCHTFIEGGVRIGDNVTIKSGNFLWDGIIIENDVFLGPNVVFTNDLRPRSKKRVNFLKTFIKKGVTIGANSSILAGITIGEFAMIGMGTLVTKDVPSHALVYGQPATIRGWVNESGEKLKKIDEETYKSSDGQFYKLSKDKYLIKL